MFLKIMFLNHSLRNLLIIALLAVNPFNSTLLAETKKSNNNATSCHAALANRFSWTESIPLLSRLLNTYHLLRISPVRDSNHPDQVNQPDPVVNSLKLDTLPDGFYRGFAPTLNSPLKFGEMELYIHDGILESKMATDNGIVEENAEIDILKKMLIVQIGDTIYIQTQGQEPQEYDYDNFLIILFSDKNKGFERALHNILNMPNGQSLPRLTSTPEK